MKDKIISLENFKQAYLKMTNDMELDGRARRYRGWDNLKLHDIETNAAEIITSARQELIDLKPLSPAMLLTIPKRGAPHKLREIFVYNLKDRIKAQAVYQVLEPLFNEQFSPYLFSYRSSHNSYFAARSAVRHYRKYWQRDSVLVTDISDYTGNIQHEALKEKIRNLNWGEEVEKILSLFIGNATIREGKITNPTVGVVQGIPLVPVFYNLYLNDFDKKVGPAVDFYRRVGDDLIAFDQKVDRIDKLKKTLEQEVKKSGLKLHPDKTNIQPAHKSFNFLGYNFFEGNISLPPKYHKSLVKRWQQSFVNRSFRNNQHRLRFVQILNQHKNHNQQGIKEQIRQLVLQKNLVSDSRPFARLSEDFFHLLTRYLFKTYTPRNRRLLKKKIEKIGPISLYHNFINTRHGTISRKN